MNVLAFIKSRWVVWVWNHTPTCAEMSRLASRSLDEPPSLKVRVKMWLHYFICVWCRRYEKHLRFLHRAAPRMQEELGPSSSRNLSEEAKHRILARLEGERRH